MTEDKVVLTSPIVRVNTLRGSFDIATDINDFRNYVEGYERMHSLLKFPWIVLRADHSGFSTPNEIYINPQYVVTFSYFKKESQPIYEYIPPVKDKK